MQTVSICLLVFTDISGYFFKKPDDGVNLYLLNAFKIINVINTIPALQFSHN